MAARADPDRDRIDRAIQVASWLGAAVMFAYGAALSFDVLHTIAQAAGNGHPPSRDDPTSGPRHLTTAGRAPDA